MTVFGPFLASTALALIVERFAGYPDWAHRRIGHPVEWIGWTTGELDVRLNVPEKTALECRLRGLVALTIVAGLTLAASVALAALLRALPLGWAFEALAAVPLLAQKSLRDHVRAVLRGFDRSLKAARDSVSQIVGRDPARLDEAGIARAAIESLAENASDGVVAPVFWFALFGLPGIAVYKAVNTADSMIGHKSERYKHFGWAAARLDDLVNLPASRLTGLLFAAAAAFTSKDRGRDALDAMWRDASKHQSPNAGWPEAAMAGALGIRLGGPRSYDGQTVDLPTMGHGRGALGRDDIRRALRLYGRALWILFVSAAVLALAL